MTPAATVAFEVGADDTGRRIDVVLAARPEIDSRAQAQRLIAEGNVRVAGETVRRRVVLAAGQRVEARLAPRPPVELAPEEVPLAIRYEDDDLLVVDKPPGVVTHPSRGHAAGTLVHGLLALGIGGGEAGRPGIVHRLDRDTSGLLVVARNERAHRLLQELLRDRRVERRYLALVHGRFPAALTIDRPIGRDRRNRIRHSTATDRPREARTHVRRIHAYDRHSLVEARRDTGRTPQIRVHREAAGFPVVGDPVYGRRGADRLGLDRQFLHAWRIAFPHPVTGEPVAVESPLPPDLEAALARIAPHGAAPAGR